MTIVMCAADLCRITKCVEVALETLPEHNTKYNKPLLSNFQSVLVRGFRSEHHFPRGGSVGSGQGRGISTQVRARPGRCCRLCLRQHWRPAELVQSHGERRTGHFRTVSRGYVDTRAVCPRMVDQSGG